MALTRKTPLKRGDGLKRTGRIKVKPLPAEERDRRRLVREDVVRRDGARCRLRGVAGAGECFGGPSFQHVVKASQGGAYSAGNGVVLCVGHNCRIEADADLARIAKDLGLAARKGQR